MIKCVILIIGDNMNKNIIAFIIIAIVFTSIGVFATTAITADQINYDENTTVKDKIDDLYTRQTNTINKYATLSIGLTAEGFNSSDVGGTLTLNGFNQKYRTFVISSITLRSGCTSCKMWAYKNSTGATETITTGVTYNVSDYSWIMIKSQTKPCDSIITFSK